MEWRKQVSREELIKAAQEKQRYAEQLIHELTGES